MSVVSVCLSLCQSVCDYQQSLYLLSNDDNDDDNDDSDDGKSVMLLSQTPTPCLSVCVCLSVCLTVCLSVCDDDKSVMLSLQTDTTVKSQ